MNPNASDRAVLLTTRILVILLAALGLVALNFFRTILAMALWAYTMYGAGITPALLAALVWPRATRQAGIASIAVGSLTTVIWEIAGLTTAGYPLGINTIYPALAASITTLLVVTFVTEK